MSAAWETSGGRSGERTARSRSWSRRMPMGVTVASRLCRAVTACMRRVSRRQPACENRMKRFDQPVRPAHPFPGIGDSEHGNAGQENPLEGLDAGRRQWFPGHARLTGPVGSSGGSRDTPPGNGPRPPIMCRVSSPGRQSQQTGIVGLPLASTAFHMEQVGMATDVGLISRDATVLDDADHTIRVLFLAGLPEREALVVGAGLSFLFWELVGEHRCAEGDAHPNRSLVCASLAKARWMNRATEAGPLTQ